ncbi:amidohydrolase [Catenulispora sp. NF23]|uniref:amidohydrolase n=1 Tax=Catenulispora pinistramenti TaxID=2705254 RepID=UPI001BA6A61F|nr:amidohydrolase [Catenulispora pinistramenti]MBS2532303.1 amidohydrolase [Catenulispora pinistramenti]
MTQPAAPAVGTHPNPADLLRGLEAVLPGLRDLYKDLHAHPELSFHEVRTAGIVAQHLRASGWEVTEGLGGTGDLPGTGVVGVLRGGLNGAAAGPVILVRADMDALPVAEETGLPYASTVTATDRDGTDVPVMHACGHDVHVTCLLGVADLLAANRAAWGGTVVAVFQPAEEVGGAPKMIEDGFLDRFPRPEICLGQHVAPAPAGLVGSRPGPVMSACDTIRVKVFGRGGHGSMPESTVDPVVIAAAIVMRLQTIVTREIAASQQVVVTVGSLRAGTRANVIPDEAELGITVRTASPTTRTRVLAAIERIVNAEAAASGAERMPEITTEDELPLLVNDPAATEAVLAAFRGLLGPGSVFVLPSPLTGSEDFGNFGTALGAPTVFWHFGGLDLADFTEADIQSLLENGIPATLPTNHSPKFAPAVDPTLEFGVRLMIAAAGAWLAGTSAGE